MTTQTDALELAGRAEKAASFVMSTDSDLLLELAQALRALQAERDEAKGTADLATEVLKKEWAAHRETLDRAQAAETALTAARAEIAGLREQCQRDMLNAILSPNPEVAAKVARFRDAPSPPNPEGKIPFEVALWVTEVATQLGIKSREEMEEDARAAAQGETT